MSQDKEESIETEVAADLLLRIVIGKKSRA